MKKFYKEHVVPFRICKVCGFQFKPAIKRHLGLCNKHRRQFHRQFYLKHKDEILVKWHEWYKDHVEERRKYVKEWYIINRNYFNKGKRERRRINRALARSISSTEV